MQLTENFTVAEFERSATATKHGIDNTMRGNVLVNAKELCLKVLQPARDALNMPLTVSAGYRSSGLNPLVGGAKNSHHMYGMAADVKCKDNRAFFEYVRENLPFTQLIWEYGDDNQPQWVHVSYDKRDIRKQVLRIDHNGRREM